MTDRLENLRRHYLDDMKTSLKRVKEIAERSLERIDRDDIDGYYSTHHDVVDVAFRVYRASKALGVLKQLDGDIQRMLVPTGVGAEVVDPFDVPPPEEVDVTREESTETK